MRPPLSLERWTGVVGVPAIEIAGEDNTPLRDLDKPSPGSKTGPPPHETTPHPEKALMVASA
jgi:hypothetical protein